MNLLSGFRAKSPTRANVWMSWISKMSLIHQSISLVGHYMVFHFEVQMCLRFAWFGHSKPKSSCIQFSLTSFLSTRNCFYPFKFQTQITLMISDGHEPEKSYFNFRSSKTFTTCWSGCTVQVWVQVWAPAGHLVISLKAVPEGNQKFREQNQRPSSWAALLLCLQG